MPNMSYCRFTNTLNDLRECYDHIDDGDLGEAETDARQCLIKLCQRIASDFDEED